ASFRPGPSGQISFWFRCVSSRSRRVVSRFRRVSSCRLSGGKFLVPSGRRLCISARTYFHIKSSQFHSQQHTDRKDHFCKSSAHLSCPFLSSVFNRQTPASANIMLSSASRFLAIISLIRSCDCLSLYSSPSLARESSIIRIISSLTPTPPLRKGMEKYQAVTGDSA